MADRDSIPEDYRARFRRVLEYIDAHVAEPLSVAELSRVAAFSKYHFHRQFSALFEISVHDYVQLVRLRRATQTLGFQYWSSVLHVALDCGYESAEAFARAFKKRLGQTPSAFQSTPDWARWDALYAPVQTLRREYMKQTYKLEDVRIVQFPQTQVAVFEHRGDPKTIPDSVRRFIAWRREVGLTPPSSATFNVFWENPDATSPDDYRLDLCAGTSREVAPNDAGVVNKVIPSGRCAVLRHIGPDPLDATFRYLYLDWLPSSGESPRDFPPFAQRVAFPPFVPEHESIVDLYLPLH